jgi:hypothetical protein
MDLAPAGLAASALYDSLLQAALRQFFSRATFETEPIPSLSSDGRLAIEPTGDPSVLSIRWFGTRHILHVPRPPAVHEPRGPARAGDRRRAVGALPRHLRSQADARARRPLPRGDRGSLRRRLPRYAVATRIPRRPAPTSSPPPSRCCASRRCRATRTGHLVGRAAARGRRGPWPPGAGRGPDLPLLAGADRDQELLPGLERPRHRLSGQPRRLRARPRGHREVRGAGTLERAVPGPVPGARAGDGRHPRRLRRAEPDARDQGLRRGVQTFSFRNARWHLLDIQAKYDMWAGAIGNPALAERLFQTALDLSDHREGALFVVLRDPAASLGQLVAPGDQLDATCGAPRRTRRPATSSCTCCAAAPRPTSTPRCSPASPAPTARW